MAVHGSDDTKPLACTECGKRFLNNSALACHSKIHANIAGQGDPNAVAGYDCPICGTPFEQIHSLKEHVHVHKDGSTGMYSCPHCQKVCKPMFNLSWTSWHCISDVDHKYKNTYYMFTSILGLSSILYDTKAHPGISFSKALSMLRM